MGYEEVNPGNIRQELIDSLLEQEATYVMHLIEATAGSLNSTQIKRSSLTPKDLVGRHYNIFDRHVSADDAKDINEVFELIKEAIDDKLDRENIIDSVRPIFTEEYPPYDAKAEAITYKVKYSRPALIAPGKPGTSAGRQDWKPKLREIMPDPDHPNKKLYVYGQLFDNMIELTCWARTNKAANQRVLWLQKLMSNYVWFFKYKGVGEVLFQERDSDYYIDVDGNKLCARPLRYLVRTERINTLSEFVLLDYIVRARVASSTEN